jgi:hypothetical protein
MQKLFAWVATGCLLFSCTNSATETSAKDTTAASATTAGAPAGPPPQSEFADARYTEMGKKTLAALTSGDIPAYVNDYADNAVMSWSAGDSLVGKEAISKYWTNRRSKVIDSLSYENDIWLPMKVNTPQKGPDMPGIWLLNWVQIHVKYKNGAKLTFWVHTDYHFNNADKIDRAIQYIDRAPINKALGH